MCKYLSDADRQYMTKVRRLSDLADICLEESNQTNQINFTEWTCPIRITLQNELTQPKLTLTSHNGVPYPGKCTIINNASEFACLNIFHY